MNGKTASALILAGSVALVLGAGCSKGSTLGGTEGDPAAVETAGVPEFEGHGAEADHDASGTAEHDNIATPAEQHASEVPEVHSTAGVGASSAGDLPPDGGNVVTTDTAATSTTP